MFNRLDKNNIKPPHILLSFLVLLLLSPVVVADLKEYAYRSTLSESDQALQRIELPVDILLSVTRSDLGDVMVFDASGKPLPSWIRQRPAGFSEQQIDLSFYRFNSYRNSRSKTVTTRKHNRQADDYSELQITQTFPVNQTRQDYIIELSEQQRGLGINQIELQWIHQPADQLLKLKVEAGNDLDQWQILHRSKSLAAKTDKKDWRVIDAIPAGKRYIRLTALKSVQSFELQKATGRYVQRSKARQLWHQLGRLQAAIDDSDYYRFSMPSPVNAEALRFLPATDQMLIKGDLYASTDDFENKRRVRTDIQQHNIADNSQIQPNVPVSLSGLHYKHWWFKSYQPLDTAPQLELAYPVYELLFLGNNNGPFSLVWGNYEAKAPANDLIGILSRSEQSMSFHGNRVFLGEIAIAGGESRLSAEKNLPWLKWLLWLLLFVAVAITANMALSLYRDMNP